MTAGPLAQPRMEASGVGDVGSSSAPQAERSEQLWGINTSKPGTKLLQPGTHGRGMQAGRCRAAQTRPAARTAPRRWHPATSTVALVASAAPSSGSSRKASDPRAQEKRAIPTPSPEHKVNRRGFPSNCKSCRNTCYNSCVDARKNGRS